jgi:hypothetical protein
MRRLPTIALLLALPAAAAPVTLRSLLTEMTDREAIARYPEPAYLCRQFSSYDRAKKTPDDPKGWFANNDFDQFIRIETNGGRKEFVMMDADGPGAIVRLWSANPPGGAKLRFYLDGAAEPAWTVDFQALTGGKAFLKPPLSAVCSHGWNSYLPIPYATHCKVTSDKRGFYYQVNYRTYAAGTTVETFSPDLLETEKAAIDLTQTTLAAEAPLAEPETANTGFDATLAPGADGGPIKLFVGGAEHQVNGGGAVRELTIKATAEDSAAALRGLVLEIVCDGETCVWCPVSDFFGSGAGANAYHDWYNTVAADGAMTCHWLMPYKDSFAAVLHNLGKQTVQVSAKASAAAWQWDERSMHFRANWHWDYPLPTRPMRDWNYLSATGAGVYVGDALAVFNPVPAWWGEGDEKVYVDGETFPSHMGTGTEDYYGYAWCDPTLFMHPFHAEVRADGPGNGGNCSVTRVRSLDAIPFTRDLRFDMEVWHWADCKVCYACTTWWYAKPGATCNRQPQPEGAVAPIMTMPAPFKIAGAKEAEKLAILAKSDGLPTSVQDMGGFSGQWSDGKQLWVQGRAAGDFVELKLPAAGTDPKKLTVYLTKSWDYGILKMTVNGQPAGDPVDLYAEQPAPSGPLELGTFAPVDGAFKLRFEVVGKNPKARGSGSYFGIDAIVAK